MPVAPKVSVIVPVFNAGEKLVPSIESLLNQTLKDIEIIIVNDASTDNSGSVIDQLAKKNANIVPVHFSENKGVHEARLAGLKKSTAPWIGFLDADDFARPNMFYALLEAAEVNKVDIVVCGWQRVNANRKLLRKKLSFSRNVKVKDDVFERFCGLEFGTGMLWNKLYRREIILPHANMHFPWRQRINEDLLINIGCFSESESVFLLKDVLYEYVFHKDSATAGGDNIKAYVETFRAYALAILKYSDLDERKLSAIMELYRNQFSLSSYSVDRLHDLADYRNELAEAVEVISLSCPLALAALSSRRRLSRVPVRVAIESILKRIVLVFK